MADARKGDRDGVPPAATSGKYRREFVLYGVNGSMPQDPGRALKTQPKPPKLLLKVHGVGHQCAHPDDPVRLLQPGPSLAGANSAFCHSDSAWRPILLTMGHPFCDVLRSCRALNEEAPHLDCRTSSTHRRANGTESSAGSVAKPPFCIYLCPGLSCASGRCGRRR